MTTIKTTVNTNYFKGTVITPTTRLSFNKWIDNIYNHLDNLNKEKYEFNKSSTT